MYYIDDTTKQLADKVLDMTKAGVVEIWEKLQQAAPALWKLVVRQMMIDGVEYLIAAGMALVVVCTGIYCFHQDNKHPEDDGGWAIGGIFITLIGLVCFTAFLVNGLDLALNPSYWALKEVMGMVRGH